MISLLWVLWCGLAPRLQAMQLAAARWSGGEWSHRAGITGDDELGRLGRAYDSMAARLQPAQVQRELDQESVCLSEKHFRSLIENSSDVLIVLDAQGTMSYVGPSVERVLGHVPDALLGCEVHSLIHPDDQPLVSAARARIFGGQGWPSPSRCDTGDRMGRGAYSKPSRVGWRTKPGRRAS